MLRRAQLFDDALRRNGRRWIAGGPRATYADCALFEYVQQHEIFAPGHLDGFPMLRAHAERFAAIGGVDEYLASRQRKEPLHNKYSHFHRGWVAP